MRGRRGLPGSERLRKAKFIEGETGRPTTSMDLSDVGALCAVCGAQDFLPFRCKGCKKMLCLAHRSSAMHECAGLGIKDVTSMDCIICGKSIKYEKGVGEDEVWNHHFATECTKQPEKKVAKALCPAPGCRNVLGPSNTYKCEKCGKTVCLSHRNPSNHTCANPKVQRASFLNRVSNQPKKVVKTASAPKPKARVRPGANDPGNTVMGTAVMRGKPIAPEQAHSCPFCPSTWPDVASLQRHVDREHGEGPAPAPPLAATGLSSPLRLPGPSEGVGSEQCPQCRLHFTDPVALVEHFESAHGGGDGPNGGLGPGAAKKDKCTVS